MKIAVISDIHGNMEALDSVLEDISKKECDKIFVLGDYAMAGPEPDKTVDYFAKKIDDSKFTMIQGNTDLMIADYSEELYNSLKTKAPIMAEALQNDVEIITAEHKEFLKNLPAQKEVTVDGIKFLLVHGSPRKNNEDILPDTPTEELDKMLENVNADVVLCGHTHIPCGFQTESKKTVVNAGSVGRTFFVEPDSFSKACYLTIDVENKQCAFQHHFIPYDREKATEKLIARKFNGSDKLANMLINPEIRHF